MRKSEHEAEYLEFVRDVGPSLHRMAVAASRDRHQAEDLVQVTLEKLYVAWPKIRRDVGNPRAYARTMIVRSLIDDRRRPVTRREINAELLPETPVADGTQRVVDRDWLRTALDGLSARQRVSVVLRHLEGLSVAECAQALGTSESNIKAATREGMAALKRSAAAMGEEAGHE